MTAKCSLLLLARHDFDGDDTATAAVGTETAVLIDESMTHCRNV